MAAVNRGLNNRKSLFALQPLIAFKPSNQDIARFNGSNGCYGFYVFMVCMVKILVTRITRNGFSLPPPY